MWEIFLNVYDVTASENERTNNIIMTLNGVTHALGLGGVFHGAIEVLQEEWSFGYCEQGSGIYPCQPRKNPLYTFRQTVSLGFTNKTPQEIAEVLNRMRWEWQGNSYDLLTRNCCNFCEDFVTRLGADPVPAWLNRFATGAESTIVFADNVFNQMNCLSSTIQRNGQEAFSKVHSGVRDFLNSVLDASRQPDVKHR